MTCKIVEDFYEQGALAVQELGPERRQSRYRTLSSRVATAKLRRLEDKGLRKGLPGESTYLNGNDSVKAEA